MHTHRAVKTVDAANETTSYSTYSIPVQVKLVNILTYVPILSYTSLAIADKLRDAGL